MGSPQGSLGLELVSEKILDWEVTHAEANPPARIVLTTAANPEEAGPRACPHSC